MVCLRGGTLLSRCDGTGAADQLRALRPGTQRPQRGQFSVQLYDSEFGGWVDLQVRDQAQLQRIVLNIETQGFRIVRLCAAKA